jgi:hypothetical protein
MARSEQRYKDKVEPTILADSLILSDGRSDRRELTDDLTLIVEGRLERTAPPMVNITVRYTPNDSEAADRLGGHPMVVEVFTPLELVTEAVRERFITVVERTHSHDFEGGRTRLRNELDELAERIASGRLLVLDETVRCLIEVTESVQYRPHAERPHWRIRLVDERTGTDRILKISTQEWVLPDPGFLLDEHIPDQLGLVSPFHDYPERWRTIRSVWQRMDSVDR